MNVLIIEDEPLAAQRLEKLMKEIDAGVNVLDKIDSVKRSVEWLKKNEAPHLILMDIQLADGISFEIFDQCEVTSPVIFTTAYDEYAIRAFKVNSIDYILKPIDVEELTRAFTKYELLVKSSVASHITMKSVGLAMQMLTRKYKERFVTRVGEHLKTIEVPDVLFFFSLEKTTFGQTRDGRKHILDFSMDQLEGLMDPKRFFRINRKYMISVQAIADMISYTNSRLKLIIKTTDADVIVARERVQEFKEWLDQ